MTGLWSDHPRRPPARSRAVIPRRSEQCPLFSDGSEAQLRRLHEVPGPDGRTVSSPDCADQSGQRQCDHIRLPLVLGLIAVITFGLLFL